ncbi:MAG: hypothetical protein ACRC10_00920 [Thermoguttaceae bacterium]
MADERGCTFLLTTHFSKAVKANSSDKMLGSTAIPAIARTVWYVYPSPETPHNRVYSYDTINGIYEYIEVTETFALKSDHINSLTIEDETGNIQTIETTDVHPFWVVTDQPDLERAARSVVDESGTVLYHENLSGVGGFWGEAKDLRVGDVFLGSDGKLSTLIGVTRVEQTGGIAVFNFTVEGNSNYFVLEKDFALGQTCVLVHNSCAVSGRPSYQTNIQHNTHSSRYVPGKTPEPKNAAEVFKRAVRDPKNPRTWYAIVDKKTIYRFFSTNENTVHFSGYVEGKGNIKKIRKMLNDI